MPKSFRLTDDEQETLFRTAVNLNRELVRIGKMPLKESEILHKILEQTLKFGEIEVTRDGYIRVLSQNEVRGNNEPKRNTDTDTDTKR